MLTYNQKEGKLQGKIKNPITGSILEIDNNLEYFKEEHIPAIQIALYVMIGGGMLGRFGTCQPADFYIDDRVGKLPYPKKQIYQVAKVLWAVAEKFGKDPHNLPEINLPSCWVW